MREPPQIPPIDYDYDKRLEDAITAAYWGDSFDIIGNRRPVKFTTLGLEDDYSENSFP